MNLHSTPDGACFPDQPYFPAYLGNGVDGVLVNLLGSGDAWNELCDYGAPLALQRSPGWFKSDRRTRRGTDLVYGSLVPLFEFASCPWLNGDRAVPRNCAQVFDPRTASVATVYDQKDHETGEWMKVRVTTFLTRAHVLVERYEVLAAPREGVAFTFFLNSPSEPHLRIYERPVTMDRASLRVEPRRSQMVYQYALESYRGGARSWCDVACEAGDSARRAGQTFVHGWLRTRPLRKGEAFTRYLAAVDNADERDWRGGLSRAIGACRRSGYRRVRARHCAEWKAYFGSCRVEIPDSALAHVYDVSRYLLRANQHPCGFLPMGLFSYLWQGVMFWDAGFAALAWLGAGNLAEARQTLAHLGAYLPAARRLARRRGLRGARLEWTVEREKFTPYPFFVTQVHNNAFWAHAIFAHFDHSGDLRFLREMFPLMGEMLLFVADGFLEKRGDGLIVRRCEGVDESISREKVNDTWTCGVVLRALMDYREAVRRLGRASAVPGLDGLIDGLRRGLERNVDGAGVMQSFQGGKVPHWGSLVFDLFPDHRALKPTLRKMMENRDPETGVVNFHGLNRYAEKAFPWAGFWAVRILARAGDAQAIGILRQAVESVNFFGGIPERVFYHGERVNHWFLTGHAAMAWALQGMLAVADERTLRVLGGAARAWRDVRFEGIHAGAGLVVSAEVRGGRLRKLRVVNLRPQTREILLAFGGGKPRRALRLRPGTNHFKGLLS
jgi:hypothetical protein